MDVTNQQILTLNGGSSSLKFALYAPGDPPQCILRGAVERIGHADALFTVDDPQLPDAAPQTLAVPDHPAALEALLDWLDQRAPRSTLCAVGHRVVHGGPRYSAPARVDAALLDELRRLSPFDPEHLPAELALIEALQLRWPELPQVACFDTAFHHNLPRVAQLLPIPRRYFAQGVRRYGFHGLSYTYLMDELARVAGPAAAGGRVVLAHLGHGASLAAVQHGQPVDTTMSFTPAAGVPMGTRSGDLDPGLVQYLARSEGLDAAGWNRLINHESGLRGVSETSADLRELLAGEADDPRAADAVALFCYAVKQRIGAYAAVLGGLDTLVFAGGIGEHAPAVRARICAGLEFLGLELDPAQNSSNAAMISAPGSSVMVHVMRTDEQQVIAAAVYAALGPLASKEE